MTRIFLVSFALAAFVQMVVGFYSNKFIKRAVFVGGAGATII
ncbi:hypothetical protein NST21_05060 [Peribacillus sp. FSL K6-1552]